MIAILASQTLPEWQDKILKRLDRMLMVFDWQSPDVEVLAILNDQQLAAVALPSHMIGQWLENHGFHEIGRAAKVPVTRPNCRLFLVRQASQEAFIIDLKLLNLSKGGQG